MPLPANARKPNEPIQTHEPIASYVRRMLQIHVVTPTPMKNDDAVDQCICQMYIMTHLQLFFFLPCGERGEERVRIDLGSYCKETSAQTFHLSLYNAPLSTSLTNHCAK